MLINGLLTVNLSSSPAAACHIVQGLAFNQKKNIGLFSLEGPVTQYFLKLWKSFCNDIFRIEFHLPGSPSPQMRTIMKLIVEMVSIFNKPKNRVSDSCGYEPWTYLGALQVV
jgi:hypothetical protein